QKMLAPPDRRCWVRSPVVLSLPVAPSEFTSFRDWFAFIQRLSSRKDHPAVERCSALLTAAARLDSQGVSHSLDRIAEADFPFDEKSRKPHPMSLAFNRIGFCCAPLLHVTTSEPELSSCFHTPSRHPTEGARQYVALRARCG